MGGGGCGREGVGRMEWSEGEEWDNCNSIINKYIFLKKEKKRQETTSVGCECGERELLCTVGGNVNGWSHCGK